MVSELDFVCFALEDVGRNPGFGAPTEGASRYPSNVATKDLTSVAL